ncbi:hypothetical protein GBA52_015105 [Prunus armeniaca]|nr:hypothetical protein GBA52_015105 [Prunus armeniaca]
MSYPGIYEDHEREEEEIDNEEIGEQEINEDLNEEFDEGINILLMAIQTLIHVLHQFEGDEGHIKHPLTRRRITIVGYDYIYQPLNDDPAIFRQVYRMYPDVFQKLCTILREKTLLKGTRYICVEEMLAAFLQIVGQNSRYCVIHKTFGPSQFATSKYFPVDCGFANRRQFLAPFQGVRYHLQDFAGHGRDPENENELFNLRHASLRNVIKRIFGIFKSQFTIFKSAPPFLFKTQAELVLACAALRNFLRKECCSNEFPIEPTDESLSSSSSSIPVDEEDNFELA